MMKRIALLFSMVVLAAVVGKAQTCVKYNDIAQLGGRVIVTAGVSSTTKTVQTFPSATISIFSTGTTTPVSIFSDSGCSVSKSNPLTADATTAAFSFYLAPTRIDIRIAPVGGTPSPFTISDVLIGTGSGSSTAGGSNTQIQYNNAGVLGGVSRLTWDGSTLLLKNATINQNANGDTAIKSIRATDTSPAGFFQIFQNAAQNTTLFSVDIAGAVGSTALSVSGTTALTNLTVSGTTTLSNPLTVSSGGTGKVGFANQNVVPFYNASLGRIDETASLSWDKDNARLVVGTPFQNVSDSNWQSDLIVASTLNGTRSGISTGWFGTGIAGLNAALLNFYRARGTPSSPATIVTGDTVGMLNFTAYSGSSYTLAGQIRSVSTGTISAGSVPGQLQFYSSAGSSANLVLTLDENKLATFTDSAWAKNFSTTGTSGTGYITLGGQSAKPTACMASNTICLFGYRPTSPMIKFSWTQEDGFLREIISTGLGANPPAGGPLTADRLYNFPDANATLVQPATAGAGQFATGISVDGVITFGTPSGGISGLTTNTYPRATSATAIGDGHITDNGSVNSSTLPFQFEQSSTNFNRWTRDSSGNLTLTATLLKATAPSASLQTDATGNCTAGAHLFKVTYVTAGGETDASSASGSVTCDASHTKVTVTIPTASDQYTTNVVATGRNIYATTAGGSTYFLVAASPVVANNSDTSYTFNAADASLLATQAPTTNTAIDTRLFISNLGNAAIGITTAVNTLHDDNQGRTFAVDGGTKAGYISAGATNAAGVNDLVGRLNFYNIAMGGQDHRTAAILSYNDGAVGQGSLTFATSPNNVGSVERMKIAYDGSIRMGSINTAGGTLGVTSIVSGTNLFSGWYDNGTTFIGGWYNNGRFAIGNNASPSAALSIGTSNQFTVSSTGVISWSGNVIDSPTAPTIASGFGTSPSIAANNGTAAFTVNVGTGGTASAGVITMPTATTGWICNVENRTGVAANRADQRTIQTATSTTSVTVQNQTVSTGGALAWTASDVLTLQCRAY